MTQKHEDDCMCIKCTKQAIIKHIEALMRVGLVEVTGITDEGEWLYSATEKSANLTETQRWELISKDAEEHL